MHLYVCLEFLLCGPVLGFLSMTGWVVGDWVDLGRGGKWRLGKDLRVNWAEAEEWSCCGDGCEIVWGEGCFDGFVSLAFASSRSKM